MRFDFCEQVDCSDHHLDDVGTAGRAFDELTDGELQITGRAAFTAEIQAWYYCADWQWIAVPQQCIKHFGGNTVWDLGGVVHWI
jgi:hypothetical protein